MRRPLSTANSAGSIWRRSGGVVGVGDEQRRFAECPEHEMGNGRTGWRRTTPAFIAAESPALTRPLPQATTVPGASRLLRLVVTLDAVASGALIVVVPVAVPVLVVWGTPTLVLVVGLLLIDYMVALASLGATAGMLACSAIRTSRLLG